MDAPPIQYTRTDDGVNIAYWTLGEGVPVLYLHGHGFSHVAAEWEVPALRDWYERAARDHCVVRLNLRGGGLSDIDVEIGLEQYALDMDAVADAMGAGSVVLFGCGPAGSAAIHYAATRPNRVAQLILFDATANQSVGRSDLI